jgi:hypothetical protein
MKDEETHENDRAWRRIAAAFLRPAPGPSPVQTEAFVSRVMGRLEPEPWRAAGLRWLTPAAGLALAASVGFMLLPTSAPAEPAETMMEGLSIPENPLSLDLEE